MLKFSGFIPVSIHPFFWLLAAAIGWFNTFNFLETGVWIIVILCSVLVHEYGHALTAVWFGQQAKIELIAFGGVTKRYGGKPKLWQEFLVTLNGPIAGFLLSGVTWWLWNLFMPSASNSLMLYTLWVAYNVNLFWTILNLLPVQPLDGGKLLSILLEGMFGLLGAKIALFVSLLFSGLLGLLFFSLGAFLAGTLFLILAFESYRAWKASLGMTDQDQNFILQHLLKEAEKNAQSGDKQVALEKLQRIRELSKSGLIFLQATEYAARLLAEQGEIKSAYDLLAPVGNKLSAEAFRLLHELAYRLGEWKEAIALGNRLYQFYPHYDIAIINAVCHSILGHVRPAVGWLSCAMRKGLPNFREVLEKREFDTIRSDPSFRKLENSQ